MILRYTRQALADLDAAHDHVALADPRAAASLALRLRAAIDGLKQFPERGRPGRLPGTRELVIPRATFVVPCRLVGDEIQILAVLHTARAWPPRDRGSE